MNVLCLLKRLDADHASEQRCPFVHIQTTSHTTTRGALPRQVASLQSNIHTARLEEARTSDISVNQSGCAVLLLSVHEVRYVYTSFAAVKTDGDCRN